MTYSLANGPTRRAILVSGCALAATLAHAPAAAQTGPQTPAPSAPSTPVGAEAGTARATTTPAPAAPGEIVVTALRRAERLENVPASVVAVTGQNLITAGVRRFQDLGTIAPGVQISRSGIYTQPAIRGITTLFAAPGQETNVAIYVDGFYQSDQLSTNQDLANVQDVQILKGPQGTLYGRSATGGAILITTKSPGDSAALDATASYAPRYDDRIFEAYAAAPLTSGISLGVAGYYRQNDGYIKDINGFAPNAPIRLGVIASRKGDHSAPLKDYSVRPKLRLEASSDVTFTLGYVHTYINDPRAAAYQIIGQRAQNSTANGYPIAGHRDETSLNFQPISRTKADEGNLLAEFKLGDLGTITSHSAYRRQTDLQVYDLDGTPQDPVNTPGLTYSSIQRNLRKTFTQQLDYNGDFGNLSLLGGAFYYHDNYFNRAGIEDTGLPGSPTTTRVQFNTRAWAVYIDGTYRIGDRLFVTAGGRYSEDKKTLTRVQYNSAGVLVPSQTSTAFYPDGVARTNNSAFTPRAILRYNLTQGTNLYASFSRGFKAGTINTAAPNNTLRPEKVTAYEIGVKTAQGPLRGEVSTFYYDYKDNQISALDPTQPGASALIKNSGGSHIYGVDFSVADRVTSALNLRASFEYLHARYVNFDDATNVVVNPATGLNTSVIASWSGRRIARSPDWSGSFGGDYTVDVMGGKLVASATATFSSRYAPQNASYQCAYGLIGGINRCVPGTDSKQRGRFEENGYVLVNGELTWTDLSERYAVSVFSDNLTNTRYKIINNGFFYHSYAEYNEPRTVGFRLSVRY